MSFILQKTDRSTRRGRRSQRDSTGTSYHLYCINFYDSGLSAVCNEFIHRVKLGMRRSMFVIDLDNDIQSAVLNNEKCLRMSKTKKPVELKTTDPLSITLQRIRECLLEYDQVSEKIESENNFNMYQYWLKNMPADVRNRLSDMTKRKTKTGGAETKRGVGSVTGVRVPKTAKGQTNKEAAARTSMTKIDCRGVVAREHNKVGKGEPLARKLYIKDHPLSAKLIIMIIGCFENEFYTELLKQGQPLRGIVHFLPEESAYDILVPRPRREKALKETIEKIQKDINSLRKRTATKPVGIFQQQLPQMSMCLATKFSDDIFDQLSWYIYDVETLRQQYIDYYVLPYEEINVKMDPSENIKDTFHMVESLSIQGHYLKSQMPAASSDDGTIYLYMESLMSTFGNPRELLTEVEVLLLANPSPVIQVKILDKIKVYANGFKSIVKLMKNERLFVEQANTLLTSLISYMNQSLMKNIYHACLEYNLMRRYFNSGYITDFLPYVPFKGDADPSNLPKFAKLYLTDDAINQRIIELVNEYDDFTVREIYPSVKLYTFKRALNEVFENQKQHSIPTRLCFRDFTLFEMEQFLRELVTPKMFEETLDEKSETLDHMSVATITGNLDHEPMQYRMKDGQEISIDPSVFIRPQSLKAQKMAQLQKEQKELEQQSKSGNKTARKPTEDDTAANVQYKPSKGSLVVDEPFNRSTTKGDTLRHTYIGLGPDHPMLKGYNLDDTRQTIKAKTSKYFFEEGLLKLYEEKWNFRQMNKCLSFEVNKQIVHFNDSPIFVGASSDNIRVETQHGINLRVLPTAGECFKAVLNYPNGLSLYCHDTHAEHIWSIQENELDESRRVCTPYGCVIVFYNNTDLVLIMRYNGEVYYLYNFLDGENNEEEENNSEFVKACSTYSTYSSYKPIPTEQKPRKRRVLRNQTHRTSGGTDTMTGIEGRSTQSNSSKTNAAAARRERLAKQRQAQALLATIDSELKFLNYMMALYGLSYRHLKLITSVGSVVHLQKDGKIWCGKPFQNAEWHDYCANECYSMRDDGVRMIWTTNEFRCYHSDGTVIKTGLDEAWDRGVWYDEIDQEISSSSSHSVQQVKSYHSAQSKTMYINVPFKMDSKTNINAPFKMDSKANLSLEHSLKGDSSQSSSQGKNKFFFEESELEDESQYVDPGYITYMPNSYQMQHRIYAGVEFKVIRISDINFHIETTVSAADNLSFRIYKDHLQEISNDDGEAEQEPERFSSEADADEWTKANGRRIMVQKSSPPKEDSQRDKRKPKSKQVATPPPEVTMIQIDGNNLHLLINKDYAIIKTELRKFGCDANTIIVNDCIQLRLNFSQSLSTTFRNWVEEMNSFIHCFCPKLQTLYFIEATDSDCHKKGFELMKKVPPLGVYNFCAGNYFIDVEQLETVNSRTTNHFDWYDKDMMKFPRFPLFKKTPKVVNFPMVLSTKIFVEIPAQLANVDRIHKFVEPFDKIKFRKLKYRFNEAVLFHIYPRLRLLVQQEISKRSWRSHHQENSRRRFLEQQRLSLYMAMLKHKVYPNYFQFKDHYHYHVRNIDFFEFMASKCSEKANPEHYQQPNPATEEEEDTTSAKSVPLKGRKHRKCVCPKYLKSLTK